MRLRRFAIVLLLSALAAPLAAEGQKPEKTARVGILVVGPAPLLKGAKPG
jgi:hypothetical protein